VPSNVKVDNDMPQVSGPPETLNFPNVPIKTEGGGYAPPVSYPQAQTANGGYAGYEQNTHLAQQRAAALVQQRMHQQGNGHQQNFPNLAQQGHLPQMPMQAQQQRMMAPQHQQQQQRPPQQQMPQQRPPPQGHIYTSQTDGSGDALADWEALKAARAANAVERMAADDSMRARIDAMAMRQDSGLMVPLDSMSKGKKRRAAVRVLQAEDAEASSSAPNPARFDAADDDVEPKEDPDDAINSDLDDSEDELNDGDNSDDDMVDYMLCTYDKVQRVKNKWKCTLKDGILTTNKRE
jgi:transcription initiation factor TFIIA large subunit